MCMKQLQVSLQGFFLVPLLNTAYLRYTRVTLGNSIGNSVKEQHALMHEQQWQQLSGCEIRLSRSIMPSPYLLCCHVLYSA